MFNFTDFINSVDGEVKRVLLQHKEDLEYLSQHELQEIFKFLSNGESENLTIYMQCQLLSALSDEDFMELKRKSVRAIEIMAEVVAKRKKIVDNLTRVVIKEIAKNVLLLIL